MISDKIKKNADQAIDRLQTVKNHWAQLPVDNKIKMLNGVLEKTGEYAQQWVDLSRVSLLLLCSNIPWIGSGSILQKTILKKNDPAFHTTPRQHTEV